MIKNSGKKRTKSPGKKELAQVSVCCGTGCTAQGSREVLAQFRKLLSGDSQAEAASCLMTGCHGFCEQGPLVVIRDNDKNILYQKVKVEHVEEIVRKTILGGEIIRDLLYQDPRTKRRIIEEEEVPFYKYQKRLIFGNNGKIDPTKIGDYIKLGGYKPLKKALAGAGDTIIEEIKKSGLRGRGGAGFPTGKKWESCKNSKFSSTKYIICNGDEGDPGCFQDRSILEGNPHLVIEGMIIGGYAVGAKEGYIYVRAEYPLAVKHLEIALKQARENGFLGRNILNSGFNFNIKIARGSGAFVCGESSALMASVEGRVGEPRAKHIHATDRGLWNKPTVLNNVKTWAAVPLIIKNGAKWFSSIGTETSKGTMIFSLVGKVINTGLVEVPMGITLRDLIFKIGGGIPGNRKFKAVQTGGPSGGCLPEECLDLPVDYEALADAGSMMGSGGMVVMDETACMVDVARYFVDFLVDESCGKCSSCREGLKQMLAVLNRICSGEGREGDLELLEDLCDVVKNASLCGLGTSAPNPVLSTLKYFRDEYEAHIRDRRCPAGVCKNLISYEIIEENCVGCGACRKVCPVEAISGETKKPHVIDLKICVKCGQCLEACKFQAVLKK